ncbi:MAG: hypothetical protein DKT66_13870 [Candidatus Melainabacteria bacterium]|nr:MAG: hypothetical protein DKT66_13870 [Candidatus Melainabacteria bacterium]
MTTDSAAAEPKKSKARLILFGVLCIFVAFCAVGWMLFGSLGSALVWGSELQKAIDAEKNNSEENGTRVEKVFNDAIQAKTPPPVLMSMYRTYAASLYRRDELALGDEQIDKAIALAKGAAPTDVAIADQLCHAYQDRGWMHHRFWLSNPKLDDGAKDQEMAVKVAETTFGPDHQQTNFKAPGLAVIYAEIGKTDEANKTIARSIEIAETKESAKITRWYVYAMLARIRAVQHRYKEALAAYFKCRETAISEEESNRGWDEFVTGLRLREPKKNEINVLAAKLLNKGDYAQLDSLAEQFTKEKTEYWDGFWKLDYLTTPLEWGSEVDAEHFDQLKLDLNKWLKKNPKSAAARAALANLYINRAWEIREDDDYGPRFLKMIKEAKAILAVDPDLPEKIPFAYVPLMRLTLPDKEKDQFLKVVAGCNKRWPTFFKLDSWATKYFSIRWLGEPGEQQAFIKKRADTIGGAQGDKFYARIAFYEFDHGDQEEVVGKGSEYDYPRIKRGFQQIFKDYPDAVEARIAFLRLAFSGEHIDDAKNMEW